MRQVDDAGAADQEIERQLIDAGLAVEEVQRRVDVRAAVRSHGQPRVV